MNVSQLQEQLHDAQPVTVELCVKDSNGKDHWGTLDFVSVEDFSVALMAHEVRKRHWWQRIFGG